MSMMQPEYFRLINWKKQKQQLFAALGGLIFGGAYYLLFKNLEFAIVIGLIIFIGIHIEGSLLLKLEEIKEDKLTIDKSTVDKYK